MMKKNIFPILTGVLLLGIVIVSVLIYQDKVGNDDSSQSVGLRRLLKNGHS